MSNPKLTGHFHVITKDLNTSVDNNINFRKYFLDNAVKS